VARDGEELELMATAGEVIEQLMAVIEDRRDNPPARSYTTTLLTGGVEKIGGKVIEESGEIVQAAGEPSGAAQRQHVIHEAADLLYHLFVLLAHQRIALHEVAAELARRFGTSGLDEKAARRQGTEG
jgi:phosphoribosyl-ATP pyrophosphohydrolase